MIILAEGGNGWYKCRVCAKSMSLLNLVKELGDYETSLDGKPERLSEDNLEYVGSYGLRKVQATDSSGSTDNGIRNLNTEFIDWPNPITTEETLEAIEEFIDSKGIPLAVIEELGGVFCWDRTSPFFGYLVFEYGRVKKRKIARKVLATLNSPRFLNETGEDHANKGLYNEECIRSNKSIILVEGITDWIALFILGFKNVVCSFGANLTEDQACSLRGKTVFILYDTDLAGIKGSKAALKLLKEWDSIPIILEIPDEFYDETLDKIDVNSAYKKWRSTFKNWLQTKLDGYQTYLGPKYLATYVQSAVLKTYQTSLPILAFANGVYGITGDEGTGKSTLGVQILEELASMHELRGIYINYELPTSQITARLLSRWSPHTWNGLESSMEMRLSASQAYPIPEIFERIKIVEFLTLEELEYMMLEQFDFCVIDYLQVIPRPGISDDRLKIEDSMRCLTRIAQKGKIVIFISEKPNEGSQLWKGTGRIRYGMDSGFLVTSDVEEGISFISHTKNRRGTKETCRVKIDFAHQQVRLV
jgi:5S rRNA maturation endonuclease (ribonuclease M5)